MRMEFPVALRPMKTELAGRLTITGTRMTCNPRGVCSLPEISAPFFPLIQDIPSPDFNYPAQTFLGLSTSSELNSYNLFNIIPVSITEVIYFYRYE